MRKRRVYGAGSFLEISEDKIAVCEKTARLRCRKFSDLKSACSKVLVPIKIFQFQDMLNENRFLGTFRGHSKRPNIFFFKSAKSHKLKTFEIPY